MAAEPIRPHCAQCGQEREIFTAERLRAAYRAVHVDDTASEPARYLAHYVEATDVERRAS